jgi:DNA (cytosine-5)-methyltransferase 1
MPRLLDLCCCAGGAAVGYHRAGWDVLGVDLAPQPNYPFAFVQGDALQYLADNHSAFDAVHVSPPCQGYSRCAKLPQCSRDYPLLVGAFRELLASFGLPYIIENVEGAPLQGVNLCGTMFGLKVFRHRLFESNCLLMQPPHVKHGAQRIGFDGFCCVAGHGDAGKNVRVAADHRTKAAWSSAMGIDWMSKQELTQAIPPAYSEFLGYQLRAFVGAF